MTRRRAAFAILPLSAIYTLIALGEGLWLLAIPGVIMFVIQLVVILRTAVSAKAFTAASRASHSAASRAIHAAVSCKRRGLHDVPHLATVPPRGDQAGAVEDGQVLDHGRPAHGQRGGQGGRRAVPVARQQVEDRAPSGIGERGEDVLGHTATVAA